MITEGDDFEISEGSLEQIFLSGTNNASACITILAKNDNILETEKTFLVLLNSSDSAVVTEGSVSVTIMDSNFSMLWL